MEGTGRHFAVISRYAEKKISLPRRQTGQSAGYDFAVAEDTVLLPQQITMVPTGIKAYMEPKEVLLIYIRSGLAIKHRLCLANGVGVIDADYADNPQNEGHIQLAVLNGGAKKIMLSKGVRIAQGIFMPYLIANDDEPVTDERNGGFGSTGN